MLIYSLQIQLMIDQAYQSNWDSTEEKTEYKQLNELRNEATYYIQLF